MQRSFTCRRCGAPIEIPPDAASQATVSISCSNCGQRYARRSSATAMPLATGVSSAAISTGASSGTASPSPSPVLPSISKATATPATGGSIRRSGGSRATTFAPDQLVAGRYRILRFIARGGMGEVYEVLDLELAGKLALKTIDPRLAESTEAVERFKREIQLARKVTHPNVCRIYDLGYHLPDDGGRATLFLTMELLEGQTLAGRLRAGKSLPVEEALPIGRQMAAALDAAHDADIVHRDFKSENVFLVPTGEGVRAVVTDFGIARALPGTGGYAATLTGDLGVVGTPAYMAPEQIEHGTLSAATDQYAFGVVLFEMVTGELPFQSDSPLGTAFKRLREPAPSPRVTRPDLEPVWEAVILRCLERDPGARFAKVGDAIRALEEEGATTNLTGVAAASAPVATRDAAAPEVPAGKRSGSVWRQVALLAALLAALVLVSIQAATRIRKIRTPDALAGPIVARRSVAVFPLVNRSGRAEVDWLSTAVPEMLATELAAAGELRVLPGEEVARARLELGLAPSDSLARDTLSRLAARLGNDVVVLGAFVAIPGGASDQIRLDLRLQEARSGDTKAAIAETGTSAELFALVERAGSKLRTALAGGVAPAASVSLFATGAPSNAEAARLYSEGLDHLRSFEPEAARTSLERAVEADPGSALVHSALSGAWSAVGYEEKAAAEAKRAFDLKEKLPREEALVVEARYAEATHDFARAAAIYEALWKAFPDDLEYGLKVASARTAAGKSDDAFVAVATLRRLPPPLSNDPRIDLEEAAAAGARADFERERKAAARAATGARERGAKLLVAAARSSESWALRNLGKSEEARTAAEEALAIETSLANRAGQALALSNLASILFDRGDLAGARADFERGLAVARESGDRAAAARALNNLAVVSRAQGDRDAAISHYEEALETCREIGDRNGIASTLNNLGAILSDRGDLSGALHNFEEALAVRRDLGDKSGTATALHNIGGVLRREGKVADAEARLGEALTLRREIGQKIGEVATLASLGNVRLAAGKIDAADRDFGDAAKLAQSLSNQSAEARAIAGRGDVALTRGELESARKAHDEALAIRQRIGEAGTVAESRAALARVALAAEKFPEAELDARQAIDAFDAAGARDEASEARALLARALIASGHPADARPLLDEAAAAAEKTESPAVSVAVGLARARLASAEGDRAAATRFAEASGESAMGAHLPAAGLEARALAATFAARSGTSESLATLAREAHAAGLELLARQIAAGKLP